jgi:hypothetical protein
LWHAIAGGGRWEFRPDELQILADACGEADLIAQMERERIKAGFKLIVRGSQGQDVINPLISELRQHRSTMKTLLGALKLPDDGEEVTPGMRSSVARAAANARWARRGA